jgi:hypothetical protein
MLKQRRNALSKFGKAERALHLKYRKAINRWLSKGHSVADIKQGMWTYFGVTLDRIADGKAYFASRFGKDKDYVVDLNPAQKGKRNPSPDAIRKDFAGRVGKGAELYFPEGTPTGLAKLGKLVSITTEEGTLKPVSGTAWLCADTKGKLHIGTTQNKPLWSGSAQCFGEVSQVEYEESKPHLGFPNPIVFYHKLGEETGVRPKLHADGKGGLKFKGGAYRIAREGIVN